MVLSSQGRTLTGNVIVGTCLSVLLPAHSEVAQRQWVQGRDSQGFTMPGEPEMIYIKTLHPLRTSVHINSYTLTISRTCIYSHTDICSYTFWVSLLIHIHTLELTYTHTQCVHTDSCMHTHTYMYTHAHTHSCTLTLMQSLAYFIKLEDK